MNRKASMIKLHFYGIDCVISERTRAKTSAPIEQLSRDFSYFLSETGPSRPIIRIAIIDEFYKASDSWREVRWKNGPTVRFAVKRQKRVALFSNHADVAAYVENFVHSAVGEILERRGWFRLHAAGTFETNTLQLWHAPRGSGKSVRTAKVLRHTGALIAGDEIVYFKEELAYPFPMPIATVESPESVSEKRRFLGSIKNLHHIPRERVTQPTSSFQVNAVTNVPTPFAIPTWLASVILGLGLPQMRVYLVRCDTILWLISQAMRRAAFGLRLLRDGRVRFISLDELRR